MGAPGRGNRFIEVVLDKDEDENENVWFRLHSGSRGAGNRFGGFSIELVAYEPVDDQSARSGPGVAAAGGGAFRGLRVGAGQAPVPTRSSPGRDVQAPVTKK